MNIHPRDRRKWFAANFGRNYFKSQPLINPFGLIGFAIPIVALLLVCTVALLAHGSQHGAPLAVFPLAGLTKLELLRQNKTDWTKQAERMLEAANTAGGFTDETRRAYEDLKAKIELNNQMLTQEESGGDSAVATAEQIYDDQIKNSRDKGVIQELARVTAILEVGRICGLTREFSEKHIKARTSIDKFRELAINEQARLATEFGGTQSHHAILVRDEVDTRREHMSAAIAGMMDPKKRKEDRDNPFLGLSIKQIAMESVRLGGGLMRIPPMNRVVELAMQATGDFAYVLENVARKQLLNRYEAVAPTYRIWCKRSTTPDFKTMSRVRLSEAPAFIKVPEGGQISIGMMSDSREQYALATYGRGVSFTRQMLINDDLGAFNDLIGAFGAQAARLENKTVYAILYANPHMADDQDLFDDTNHHNTGTGALGNTAFDAMFGKMGAQVGLDGETILNLVPKFLLVPKAKEATAIANLLPTGPNLAATSQNWFSGRLVPVADGELDTNGSGTTKWYAAADPDLYPGIEYAHLEGAEGPQFIRKDNESGILGIQFYAYVDFAAKAVDWRPLYYSTGSA